MTDDRDAAVRLRAFDFLTEQRRRFGEGGPSRHPEPVIPNGLALCKLHHAAFDRYLIGVTPDLEDSTGQGRRIHVPRADHLKPNRDFLAERYALFRRAS